MNTILIEKKEEYIIVQLNRGRANPINAEMVKELRQLIKDVENDDEIGGIILTGQKNFFSAGLDVIELYNYDEVTMAQFWNDFIDLIHELTSFSKPLISAISGHSPAGGCLFAICSDYRIMVDGERFQIGLNEVPVGILVPHGILELYAFWLGKGKAYQALMQGHLFNSEDALVNGLINKVVPSDELLSRAEAQMKLYLSFPKSVWKQTKKNLRAKLIEDSKVSKEDREKAMKQWWSEESRTVLGKIVDRLPKKGA